MGIVLGSGLGSFVDAMADTQQLAYADVPGLPRPTVPGHAGRLVYGKVGDVPTVVAQGRAHLYEGCSAADVTAGVRLMAAMGVRLLVLTNAAGAVNPDFGVGEWMMLSDHLNLTGTTPLLGGPNFHDMSEVYSPEWRGLFRASAADLGVRLREGVYAGLLGPQYETPAEVRMLATLGADAVGMSTVLEAVQARALGLDTVGFSCLTNAAAGLGAGELDHAEVIDVGARAAAELLTLLVEVIQSATFGA